MTQRDELINKLQQEIVKVGLARDAERLFKMILLNSVLKLVLTGSSKYDLIKYLNVKSNRCGRDLLNVVNEVYEMIKDVEL